MKFYYANELNNETYREITFEELKKIQTEVEKINNNICTIWGITTIEIVAIEEDKIYIRQTEYEC